MGDNIKEIVLVRDAAEKRDELIRRAQFDYESTIKKHIPRQFDTN